MNSGMIPLLPTLRTSHLEDLEERVAEGTPVGDRSDDADVPTILVRASTERRPRLDRFTDRDQYLATFQFDVTLEDARRRRSGGDESKPMPSWRQVRPLGRSRMGADHAQLLGTFVDADHGLAPQQAARSRSDDALQYHAGPTLSLSSAQFSASRKGQRDIGESENRIG